MAELERALIAARTKAALAVKRGRGECIATCPAGFMVGPDGRTLVPPDEQRALARIRELRVTYTMWARAAVMNGEGFRTRKNSEYRWQHRTAVPVRHDRAAAGDQGGHVAPCA